jgi:hypothetical protein
MAQRQLRVYFGPQDDVSAALLRDDGKQPETVTLPLGEILPMLADAVRNERTWLSDFDDDEVTISSDLYEVILAYQHYRRPSA